MMNDDVMGDCCTDRWWYRGWLLWWWSMWTTWWSALLISIRTSMTRKKMRQSDKTLASTLKEEDEIKQCNATLHLHRHWKRKRRQSGVALHPNASSYSSSTILHLHWCLIALPYHNVWIDNNISFIHGVIIKIIFLSISFISFIYVLLYVRINKIKYFTFITF